MRPALVTLACLLALSTVAGAKDRPAERPAWKRAAKVAPARRSADLAKGAVDPYDPAGERQKFFAAAGVDNELDAKEFAAARGKKDSFVRPFDRWESLRLCDKDGKGSIDWFEADAYRRGLRERVLKAFDADKNGQLNGAERDKANAALASGRVPGDPSAGRRGGAMASRRGRSPDRAGPGEGNQRPAGGGRRRDRTPDAQHRPDAPRPEDRQARAQALRKQWMTKRHDKDGDGKLNDAERAAMAAEQAEQERRTREYREQAERRRKEQLAKYDGDGDGQLSDAERQAMQEALRREWQQRSQAMRQRQESLRKQADGDGDGKTSGQEWRDFWTKTRAKYDTDGDGRLNGEERQKMMRELYGGAYGRGPVWVSPGGAVTVSGVGRASVNGRPMVRRLTPAGQTTWTTEDGKATVIIRRAGQD